jgi:hypothetical protein
MWKKFTTKIFISILTLITLIIVFTWFVDPFDIFDSPKINHFNVNKPKVGRHSRVYKAIVVQKIKPKILFLGTSRTEEGMDPKNQNFATNIAYNCAISAGLPIEYEYYADEAIKNGVKHIIIGTDFFAFYSKDLLHPGFDKEVFRDSVPMKYFLSLDAFESSIKTVGSKKLTEYLETGRVNPILLQDDLYDIGSYRKSFQANEKKYFSSHYGNTFSKTQTAHWKAFERILNKAYRNDVEVTIFISPSHARQWEVLDMAQGYGTFEDFKRQLVAINEREAHKNEKQPFVVWDFTGYHQLTTETVPDDPKAKMKWYWDSSHYTKELGDIVLDRMFDGNFSGGQDCPDFGTKLTSQNIEAHLAKLRTDRARWQANHPKDMAEIRTLKKDED